MKEMVEFASKYPLTVICLVLGLIFFVSTKIFFPETQVSPYFVWAITIPFIGLPGDLFLNSKVI